MTPGKVVGSGSLTVMIRAVSPVVWHGVNILGFWDCVYYGLEITQDKLVSYTATNHNFVILRGDSLQAAAIIR